MSCLKTIQLLSAVVQGFDKVFGRFIITLPFVKAMGVGPPGVTVHFDAVAIPFAGKPDNMGFELPADAVSADAILYREVAYARKIPGHSELRDEVEGEEGDDLGVQLIH